MVASKTSFVIAAVALGAATSVYAAPVQYSDGADLAARGFEDEYFQLAARDFDEEEYLFARGFASAANNNSPSPSPPFPTHSTSSSGSPPGLNGHRVLAANHGSGVPPSKGSDYYKDHHNLKHHKDGQHGSHWDQQQHKLTGLNGTPQHKLAGLNGTPQHKLAGLTGTPQHKPAGLTGSDSTHPVSGFNHKLAARSKDDDDYPRRDNDDYPKRDNDDHPKKEKMTIFAPNHKNVNNVQKHTQSLPLNHRDFEEDDAILLARSLGLDDDFFLEARSFDDDMYEYY